MGGAGFSSVPPTCSSERLGVLSHPRLLLRGGRGVGSTPPPLSRGTASPRTSRHRRPPTLQKCLAQTSGTAAAKGSSTDSNGAVASPVYQPGPAALTCVNSANGDLAAAALPQPLAPGPRLQATPALNPAAYEVPWDFVTIRGCADGETIVYKFWAADPQLRLVAGRGAGGRPPHWEERDPEETSWSNALRLWVKRGGSVELTLRKLEQYVQEYRLGQGSSVALDHQLYRTYQEVADGLERRLKDVQAAEAGAGAGPQGQSRRRWRSASPSGARGDATAAEATAAEATAAAAPAQRQRGSPDVAGFGDASETQLQLAGAEQQQPKGGHGYVHGEGTGAATATMGAGAAVAVPSSRAPTTATAAAGAVTAAPAAAGASAPSSSSASIVLDPQAQACWWDLCTVRGLADGSLLYKFGAADPPPPYIQRRGFSPPSEKARQLPQQQGQQGEDGAQGSLGNTGAEPSFSNSLWLAIKPASHIQHSLRKLSQYVQEYPQRQASSVALDRRMHRTYAKALRKLDTFLLGLEAAAEGGTGPQAREGAAGGSWSAGESSEGTAAGLRGGPAEESSGEEDMGLLEEQAEAQELLQLQAQAQEQAQGQELGSTEREGQGEARALSLAAGEDQQPVAEAAAAVEGEGLAAAQAPPILAPPLPNEEGTAFPGAWGSSDEAPEALAGGEEAPHLGAEQVEELAGEEASSKTLQEAWLTGSSVSSGDELLDGPEPATAPTGGWLGCLLAAAAAVRRWWQAMATAAAAMLVAAGTALARLTPVAWLVQRLSGLPGAQAPQTWPPQILEPHASPSIATLLRSRSGLSRRTMEAAGFDATGKTDAPLADLPAWRISQLTGHPVGSLGIYRKAFTHLTALPTVKKTAQSYERLEWLGDAVLELVVRRLLMKKYPKANEGELSLLAQSLVSGRRTTEFAEFLGLEKYICTAAYAMRGSDWASRAVLGDVFEALVGALYEDQGFAAAESFVVRVLDSCIDWEELPADRGQRRALARYCLARRLPPPKYVVQGKEWRADERTGVMRLCITVAVVLGGKVLGSGTHWEKVFAERAAATQALKQL